MARKTTIKTNVNQDHLTLLVDLFLKTTSPKNLSMRAILETQKLQTNNGLLDSFAQLQCAGDVQPQPINWLWPDRIALGKLTMIAGDPGLGKSLLSIELAKHVTLMVFVGLSMIRHAQPVMSSSYQQKMTLQIP